MFTLQGKTIMTNKRRVGWFTISQHFIHTNWQELLPLFATVVIVHCRRVDNVYEYCGLSEQFDEVSEGTVIPRYLATVKRNADNTLTVTWERVNVSPTVPLYDDFNQEEKQP